ncbi:amino acid permease [Klebsiella pneumoniae]|uniref:amino acid permease n=1 Tax=Klebsiella pneumoniae TaxID=573 RepID=UPI0015E91128|nr:amino acid permease [Klebsiella pneumoniae]QLS79480.1 amino acid permease [Klebsiella pneumoniae]
MVKIVEGDLLGGRDYSSESENLARNLSNRHIQLISIGGAIGVGLFMGSGKTISLSGTSIVLTYVIIGFFLFFMMRAMGELLLSNLNYKSFADFCAAYLGPWASFFVSWSYWLTWVVGVISECVIVGGYAQFWWPNVPAWLPAVSTLTILLILNVLTVRIFGELEFWFAIIKIVAIVLLILTSIYLVSTAYVSPDGVKASLNHVLDRDVFMPHGIMGFLAGFQIAIFSFAGIELIGTTAAETKDPSKNLPRAINSVPLRILIFYVLTIICIISVCSWARISPSSSPFVQLFVLAGLPMAAGAINLVVTLSAMSSANSGVYSTSRMLYGLALEQDAPSYFRKLSQASVPTKSLLFSCACMLVGVALLFVIPDIMAAFTLLSTICAILYIFTWSMILIAYIAYRKKRPDLHDESEFKMPGGVPMTWCCLAFFACMIVLLGLEPDTRQALMLTPAWFIFLGAIYRHINKDERHRILSTGIRKEKNQ